MPMPFFDDHHSESRIPTLINRMMVLSKAVKEGSISAEELQTISMLSTASLESKWESLVNGSIDTSGSPNKELKKLYDIIQKAPILTVRQVSH